MANKFLFLRIITLMNLKYQKKFRDEKSSEDIYFIKAVRTIDNFSLRIKYKYFICNMIVKNDIYIYLENNLLFSFSPSLSLS